jgi:allantoin racemase
MRICCQIPVPMPGESARPYYEQVQRHLARAKRPDTEVVIRDTGSLEWTSSWELYSGLRPFNYIEMLKSMIQAEKDGCDAVSVSCFFDPSLLEARQLLKIPVTGLAEASMHFAYMMGSKFAIITREQHYTSPMEAQIYRYGMETRAIKVNPVRALTLPAEQLSPIEQGVFTGTPRDPSPFIENFREVARGCIADGAEVLILGCGLLSPLLLDNGVLDVDGAAVVEPMIASLKLAETMVDLHKAGIPFISRRSTYLDVPPRYIDEVLASRNQRAAV